MLFATIQQRLHETSPKKYIQTPTKTPNESHLRTTVKAKLQRIFGKQRLNNCNQIPDEMTVSVTVSQESLRKKNKDQLAERLKCEKYLRNVQEIKKLMQPAEESSPELQRAIESILLSGFPSTTSTRKAKVNIKSNRRALGTPGKDHPAFRSSLYTGRKFAKKRQEIRPMERRISFDKFVPNLDTIHEAKLLEVPGVL